MTSLSPREGIRFKPAQWAYAGQALFYGFGFFGLAMAGWNAMFPDMFGNVAVGFEVEAWSGLQLSGAMLLAIGLFINGRWRWSPALRLTGATVCALICSALAASAAGAATGWPVALYCTGFGALGWLVAWWNLVDLRAALFRGSDGKAV